MVVGGVFHNVVYKLLLIKSEAAIIVKEAVDVVVTKDAVVVKFSRDVCANDNFFLA